MTRFDRAFDMVIGHEGGLSMDRADSGNWTGGKRGNGKLKGTKYGISAASYPNLDIRNLTVTDARAIYLRDYWNRCDCDRWPDGVAYAVFDGAVNMGVGRAVRFLQIAAGASPDGIVGPITRGKVAGADPVELIRDMLVSRMEHYLSLGGLFDRFGKGWTRRAFDVAIAATAMQLGNGSGHPDNGAALALLARARADITAAEALLGKGTE